MGFALSSMQVHSTAFANGTDIAKQFSTEGDDVSPPLAWTDAPEGTKGFAVICHDPDAPLISANGTYGFVHWVHYNIPGNVSELPENCKAHTDGKNDFGNVAYGGPMPPDGHGTHHYYFWVIALKEETQFEPGLTMWELLEKIEPIAIGMNRTIGTYQRD
ncbi:YbhB/YbcL family Raf kinase inhibitor-like protein [Aurantivibrio plasticivorans]